MTGRLELTWFEAKKFWPKLTRAEAEGFTVEDYGGGSDGSPLQPEPEPEPDPEEPEP